MRETGGFVRREAAHKAALPPQYSRLPFRFTPFLGHQRNGQLTAVRFSVGDLAVCEKRAGSSDAKRRTRRLCRRSIPGFPFDLHPSWVTNGTDSLRLSVFLLVTLPCARNGRVRPTRSGAYPTRARNTCLQAHSAAAAHGSQSLDAARSAKYSRILVQFTPSSGQQKRADKRLLFFAMDENTRRQNARAGKRGQLLRRKGSCTSVLLQTDSVRRSDQRRPLAVNIGNEHVAEFHRAFGAICPYALHDLKNLFLLHR